MKQPRTRSDRVRIWRASVTKWQLKVFLIISGLVIMALVLFYTKTIVDELVANERRTVELYSNLLLRGYSSTATDEDLLFYLDLTTNSIYFPVLITDKNEQPIFPYQQFMRNMEFDSTQPIPKQKAYLVAYIEEMKSEYQPYEIKGPNGKVIQKIFYTNSAIVRQLRYMPYIEILIVTAFILIGYVSFSTIRRNEESNIWVGMAKEAAHQLGTPLSSLLAWLELLRINKTDAESVERTADEMHRDVERLNIIATRFSKIGSQPKLAPASVGEVVERVCAYFETRLPHLGRRVIIHRDFDRSITADLSQDLFEWVIENLIKNAVESIDRHDGRIDIALKRKPRGGAILTVTDNGKGMSTQVRSRVFEPGYSTKKRGWGLGLSLSRRIVEDYHGGRITVRETVPGVGTTFAIELP
ncbi:MAG: HAMP domain-containing sensor histidine kinase [bacterium]|nr:HAMP domain-containing sensor histidine kinase [bacterium]